jgi:hypothetical protein
MALERMGPMGRRCTAQGSRLVSMEVTPCDARSWCDMMARSHTAPGVALCVYSRRNPRARYCFPAFIKPFKEVFNVFSKFTFFTFTEGRILTLDY